MHQSPSHEAQSGPTKEEYIFDIKDWFVFDGKAHQGPIDTEEVLERLKSKGLSLDDHIWRQGFEKWKEINSLKFFNNFESIPMLESSKDNFEAEAVKVPLQAEKIEEVVLNKKKGKLFFGKVMLGLASVAILLTTVLVAAVFENSRLDFGSLSSIKILALKRVALLEETNMNPVIRLAIRAGVKSPKLFMATNLPLGSKIKISIVGITGYLEDSYRAKAGGEYTVDKKIQNYGSLSSKSGEPLSPGIYRARVYCQTCSSGIHKILDKKIIIGVLDRGVHKLRVTKFNKEILAGLYLELNELRELSGRMRAQLGLTVHKSKDFTQGEWVDFSKIWKKDQESLKKVFLELNTKEVSSNIYYLKMYREYEGVTKNISELHSLQAAPGIASLSAVALKEAEILGQINILDEKIKTSLSEGVQKNGLLSLPKFYKNEVSI